MPACSRQVHGVLCLAGHGSGSVLHVRNQLLSHQSLPISYLLVYGWHCFTRYRLKLVAVSHGTVLDKCSWPSFGPLCLLVSLFLIGGLLCLLCLLY